MAAIGQELPVASSKSGRSTLEFSGCRRLSAAMTGKVDQSAYPIETAISCNSSFAVSRHAIASVSFE